MKYFSKIADKDVELQLDASELDTLVNLNGMQKKSELIQLGDSNLYSLLVDNRSYQVFLEQKEECYLVSLNGRKYSVTLEDEKSRLISSLIKAEKKQKGQVEIKAPMPGLIAEINVSEGQEIKKGDGILIIEAMKMENEIRSNVDGVVKKILGKAKDSVDKDSILMIIEQSM